MIKKIQLLIVMMVMCFASITASAVTVEYTQLGVPNINSSFKSYMDYRMIRNTSSAQYKFIDRWGWSDYDGFMRCDGEADLGITGDYYIVALGSYYGTTIGTKYRVTTDTGNVFYCALGDIKGDYYTNSTHQYSANNDIIEFLVDTDKLYQPVKMWGTANVYMPLNGSVTSIERIDFIW